MTGLLAAKNRGRTMPVPVLIGEASTLAGLVVNLPPVANELAQAFWPGGLTLVLEHAPSLAWDLGDAEGTVAVRLPDDDVARDLLRRTGPLAVSSANRSGRPAATTAQEAVEQLGTHAAVVLDGGAEGSGGQHDRRLHRPDPAVPARAGVRCRTDVRRPPSTRGRGGPSSPGDCEATADGAPDGQPAAAHAVTPEAAGRQRSARGRRRAVGSAMACGRRAARARASRAPAPTSGVRLR